VPPEGLLGKLLTVSVATLRLCVLAVRETLLGPQNPQPSDPSYLACKHTHQTEPVAAMFHPISTCKRHGMHENKDGII